MKNLTFISFACLLLPAFLFGQNDKKGCEDHPLITRYPGTYISWCNTDNFSEYHVATGKLTGYRNIDKWVDLEGKVTRISYHFEGERTMGEIYLNYRNALKKGGFEILAQGQDPNRTKRSEVGGAKWVGTAFIKNALPMDSGSKLFVGSSSSGGYGYVAGRLERPAGNVYAVVAVYQHRSDLVVVQVDIIEEAPLDDGKITVDADYIAREIAANGTVALYGIYFDFDKATVKPESKPDLDAVAAYLKKYPKAHLYIVGHTDIKGSLGYNLGLSERRAQAVVDKLVGSHGISGGRLEGKGVGPLAPKSANTSDAGRKLNRRVELVKK